VSPAASKTEPLGSRRKAAVLMVLLGDEAARKICEHLPEASLRALAQEITALGSIAPEAAAEVLQEYQRLAATDEAVARGGPDFATQFLVKALGNEESRPLVEQVRSQETTVRNFEAIQKAGPEQLVKALQQEHPQTIALVLAHLNAAAAKAVLLLLPEPARTQAVKRLAEMHNFSPEVVHKISVALQRKLAAPAASDRQPYGGVDTVAELLNRVGPKVTGDLLAAIEKDDAGLAATIRNQMFTFEDFVEVPETGLRELLAQVDKKILATGLKGASENLKNHFFKCMSSRAVEMLQEDIEALGPLRSKDVQQAQSEIVAAARKLESDGKMTLKNEAEDAFVV
jgi:flagellar motor switch protein FliG